MGVELESLPSPTDEEQGTPFTYSAHAFLNGDVPNNTCARILALAATAVRCRLARVALKIVIPT